VSTSVPPDTDSWHEAVTHGFYGARTDPLPDSVYVPGIQADVDPVVSGCTPATGPEAGGTEVTISGTLLFAPVVAFGGATATITSVADDGTSVVCTSPAGVGAVDVTVTTPGGTATVTGGFTYEPPPEPPTLTGVTPASGLAGSEVSIAGTNLASAWAVRFGALDGVVNAATDTSVSATTPVTGTGGPVDVTVHTDYGTPSLAGAFTFSPPEDAPPGR
jgi:large repetitive protein